MRSHFLDPFFFFLLFFDFLRPPGITGLIAGFFVGDGLGGAGASAAVTGARASAVAGAAAGASAAGAGTLVEKEATKLNRRSAIARGLRAFELDNCLKRATWARFYLIIAALRAKKSGQKQRASVSKTLAIDARDRSAAVIAQIDTQTGLCIAAHRF